MGTDAQRSAWILLLVSLIVFFESCYRLYIGDRYFLSNALFVIGTFLGSWGCAVFVKAAYPDEILRSCFYANESITPPPGSWCFRVNCGTRVLLGGHLQLMGSVLYGLATIVWIQEDSGYTIKNYNLWAYTSNLGASLLLIASCYSQLLAQYPDAVIRRRMGGGRGSLYLTDLQAAGWCLEFLSVAWLLTSAYAFDAQEEYDDWNDLGDIMVSLLMSIGSYFVLSQAYREGTRMDAVLIEKAAAATRLISPQIANVPSRAVVHPLSGISDLSDSKMVLRRARRVCNDDSLWMKVQEDAIIGPSVEVWRHKEAHAVRFETTAFKGAVDPLLLAAAVQSEEFKLFQLQKNSLAGSSLVVEGKLGGPPSRSLGAVVMRERFPPNPPMPAHESVFASLLTESRNEQHDNFAEVLEWAVDRNTAGTNGVIKVNPFRYFRISSAGVLKSIVWLEDIARWMPDFLLQEEMRKVALVVKDIDLFFNHRKAVGVGEGQGIKIFLNSWIWQKIHNSISPLSATVLVRTSPAYRQLLNKHPGLRTRVPDPVNLGAGTLRHPLEYFPLNLLDGEKFSVPESTKHGSDFLSNEFGAWHLSDQKSAGGRLKISVWRQELEGEAVKPFRIQAKVVGIDPLTLAMLIHKNKLNELIENSSASGAAGLQTRTSDPVAMQSNATDPNAASVLASMLGDDHVTVSNTLLGEFQHGALRVYRERKRRSKFLPGSREREFTFASVMRDVSPIKAVVVHFGVNESSSSASSGGDVVKLRRFHAWSLENDGGSDCKVTWAGLSPVGGRVEKISAWVSAGNDLKQKLKLMEKLSNLFMTDPAAKLALAETHRYISYMTIKSAIQRELKKMSLSFLQESSSDLRNIIAEVGEKDKKNSGKNEDSSSSIEEQDDDDSVVTMPLSPVESHLRMSADDEAQESGVPSERDPF